MVYKQVEALVEAEARKETEGVMIEKAGDMIERIGDTIGIIEEAKIERDRLINKEKEIIMKDMEMINTTIINIQMEVSWEDAVKGIIRRKETTMIEFFIIYSFLIK